MSNLIHVANCENSNLVFTDRLGYMPSFTCEKTEFEISKDLAKFIRRVGGWKVFNYLEGEEKEEANDKLASDLGWS